MMNQLPVSGLEVSVRLPTGEDDMALLEFPGNETETAMALISRLASARSGEPIDWGGLTVPDMEALLLRIRQAALGDRIQCDLRCGNRACGAEVEMSFSIDAYLDHYRPSVPTFVEPGEQDGWFQLKGERVQFRPPRARDQARVSGRDAGWLELRRSCVQPETAPAKVMRRVEGALDKIAPILSRPLDAECSECGVKMPVYFDVVSFLLAELRGQAAYIFEDVQALAVHFHWQEASILAMPSRRRARYVELTSQTGAM